MAVAYVLAGCCLLRYHKYRVAAKEGNCREPCIDIWELTCKAVESLRPHPNEKFEPLMR